MLRNHGLWPWSRYDWVLEKLVEALGIQAQDAQSQQHAPGVCLCGQVAGKPLGQVLGWAVMPSAVFFLSPGQHNCCAVQLHDHHGPTKLHNSVKPCTSSLEGHACRPVCLCPAASYDIQSL